MSGLAVTRVGAELLDDPGAEPAAVAESLRNIARANRWLGGAAAVRFGLRRVLGPVRPGDTLTLLDLGTGLGDLPRAAVRWAAARGARVVPLGVERSRVAAALATAAGVPTVVACAGLPPLRDRSVDVVLVSQLAHHLAPASVVRLFQVCDRLARRAVVVADLRRSRLGALGFRCAARVLGFDRITVADGITSIRRGYTRGELGALLAAAGIEGAVARRPGCRLVAVWRPRAAGRAGGPAG